MSKETKIAEKALTDADKFPRESMRERLARQYGLDAVALSGPCEGQGLVDCIVNQLERRWDRIKERFSGNHSKAFKLATKLAESYRMKDDTQNCVKDLQQIGYKGAAAEGIAEYLKAYAMGPAADMEMEQAMGTVMAEDPTPPEAAPAPMADDMAPAADDMNGDMGMGAEMPMEEPMGELPPPEGDMGVAPAADAGMGTVTLELPIEVAEQLKSQIEMSMPEAGMDDGMGMDGALENDMDIEVMDMGAPGGDLHGDDGIEEIGDEAAPGEPMGGIDDHEVHGEPGESDASMMMANKGHESGATCSACGQAMGSSGHHEEEGHAIEELKQGIEALEHGEKEESHGEQSESEHESKEKDTAGKMEKSLKPFEKSDEGDEYKEAAMAMRAGHIRAAGTKREIVKTAFENDYDKKTPKDYNKAIDDSTGDGDMLRLNNPMKMNNTDQLLHMEGKELGNAKEKNPDAPKPIFDGNLETEGYSAGDKKFQDGATMGHEEKFDPHQIEESEWTGGDKSLMGKDESFPKDKPNVPAGSSPIGGEVWEGGDLSTKGTVIASGPSATVRPNGILVEVNGKKFLAKAAIKNDPAFLAKIQEGLGKIAFNGDGRDFAKSALKVVKEAAESESSSGPVDGVTKIDTSKLEGEKFTNDADKKPAEGGAMTGKGKGSDYQNEDIVKIDTGKLEKEKFTNDAEKKADDETKSAAASKQTKTAGESEEKKTPANYNSPVTHSGDKAVEEPKALEDGNVKPEGFTAGDSKFSDGKTMGHEPKFDPHKIEEKEYTGGDSSLLGKDESRPTDKPKVPAGGGQMGHETWEGGDVSTKGTTIAETSQKRQVGAEELRTKLAEASVKEARLKAASVYCADLLANGDIRADEYAQELEKVSQMTVPAIQNLIAHTKQMRNRIRISTEAASKQEGTTAGLSIPVVRTASNNEMSLKDRLVAEFKLTKKLDEYDEMKK